MSISKEELLKRAVLVAKSLLNAGMKPAFVPYAVAQAAFETAGFNSNVFYSDNNLSGIMFINKPNTQKNAIRGSRFPAIESKTACYAHFTTMDDWAHDYIRIISLGKNKPINAGTIPDFAARLKSNGYYAADQTLYTKGVQAWHDKLNVSVTAAIQAV